MVPNPDPIVCLCGTVVVKDSKSLQLYLIPREGIKCPNCKLVVIQGNNAHLASPFRRCSKWKEESNNLFSNQTRMCRL